MNYRQLILWITLAGLMAGCGQSAAPAPPATVSPGKKLPSGQHVKTVFLILMENHNWSAIKGNTAAPYINRHVLPHASYATQYYNPPGVHPSLPNYLWLEAGTNCFPSTGCIGDDAAPSAHPIAIHQHLVTLLRRARISWRAYEENISGTSCPLQNHTLLQIPAENGVPGLSTDLYAAKHDPFVYFDDVTGDLSASSPYCVSHIRPFSELASDLRHNKVASYNFITPNVCDDMHSACPALSNPIKQGDTWLSHVIPTILASSAYRHHGAVLITWDEGEGGDGPIGMIVLSPDAKGHGYHNAIHYTHSSTLRTLQEIFHVKPWLGGAAHANALRDLFRRFP